MHIICCYLNTGKIIFYNKNYMRLNLFNIYFLKPLTPSNTIKYEHRQRKPASWCPEETKRNRKCLNMWVTPTKCSINQSEWLEQWWDYAVHTGFPDTSKGKGNILLESCKYFTPTVSLNNSKLQTPKLGIIIPIWKIKKLRHREMKATYQSHILKATRESNPNSVLLSPEMQKRPEPWETHSRK